MTLPQLNASLNAASAVSLAFGYYHIRRGSVAGHRFSMLAALAFSTLFLAFYLYYHYNVGSVRYQGQGPVRTLYLAILLTHTVLAALNLPLILRALYLAAKERFEEHKRLARWALPVWLYVSVTGVVIYFMLYGVRS